MEQEPLTPSELKKEIATYFKALSIHLRRICFRIGEAEMLLDQALQLVCLQNIKAAAQATDEAFILLNEANRILDYIKEKILIPLSQIIAKNARKAPSLYAPLEIIKSINGIYGGMGMGFIIVAYEIIFVFLRFFQLSTIIRNRLF